MVIEVDAFPTHLQIKVGLVDYHAVDEEELIRLQERIEEEGQDAGNEGDEEFPRLSFLMHLENWIECPLDHGERQLVKEFLKEEGEQTRGAGSNDASLAALMYEE